MGRMFVKILFFLHDVVWEGKRIFEKVLFLRKIENEEVSRRIEKEKEKKRRIEEKTKMEKIRRVVWLQNCVKLVDKCGKLKTQK